MNEHEMGEDVGTARVVETWLDESVQRLPDGEGMPADLLRRVVEDVRQTSQQSSRLGWLLRLRSSSAESGGSRAGMRPVSMAAGLAVAAAVMAFGVGLLALTPLAHEGVSYVVAGDGSAGYISIAEAVAVAQDGDTILVRPGHYREAVVIEQALTVKGDGPVADVIISAPEDGPSYATGSGVLPAPVPYALVVKGSDATVAGITFEGSSARVIVDGGAAHLDGLVFDGVGGQQEDMGARDAGSLLIDGAATATVSASTFDGPGTLQVFADSDTRIEANTFTGGASIEGSFGDDAVIRDNTIVDPPRTAIAFLDETQGTVERNRISGGIFGISTIADLDGDRFAPRIVGNTIDGTYFGVLMPSGSAGEIRGNTLTSNRQAIGLTDASTLVAGNELSENEVGIRVAGGAPGLEGNSITGGTTGIQVLAEARPTLADNTVCDNETDLLVDAGTEVPDTAGNDICGPTG